MGYAKVRRDVPKEGMRMRLFVAAELPQAMMEALSETSALLREHVAGRYVAPDSFHLTLAFLGEVPVARIDDACAAIEEACSLQPPIPVSFGPLGSFGRARKATLWQGFARGVDELGGLAGDVRESLADYGLSYDSTAFAPHVTLMRSADLTAGLLPTPVVERGTIDMVTLFSSDLSGERPRYSPLYSVRLQPVQTTDDEGLGFLV